MATASDQIREAFEAWDTDHSGTISFDELRRVMKSLCGEMSDADLELLMQEVDSNGNGVIEYCEFVDWLMKPAQDSQGSAIVEYSAALMPLFRVFDRDGSGTISVEEFCECFGIIQGSLNLHPTDEAQTKSDPLKLDKDAHVIFETVDRDGNNAVTFVEFVDYLRSTIAKSGLPKDQLGDFITHMSKQLEGIFYISKGVEEGRLGDEAEERLAKYIEDLATGTRHLNKALVDEDSAEKRRAKFTSGWTEPPVGLSVDRLKATHMRLFPCNVKRVKKTLFEVLCLPKNEDCPPDDRLWFAMVIRKVEWKSGKTTEDSPVHYWYDRATLAWARIPEDLPDGATSRLAYDESLEALAPELRLFCLLKTEANFGLKLTWSQIMNGLQGGVDMGFITVSDRETYQGYMQHQALKMMHEDGRCGDIHEDADLLAHAEEYLNTHCVLRPRQVMGTMAELDIIHMSPVWADFVSHAD